jgi:hypothetical protein
MRQHTPLLCVLLLCIALAAPLATHARPAAQEEPQPASIVINHHGLENIEDELQNALPRLNVLFTVRDTQGNPIPEPAIRKIEIVLDPNNTENSFIADWGDPERPIYIALLLDTSGSMDNAIEDLKIAADSAIHKATANTYIGPYRFSDNYTSLLPQNSETNQRQQGDLEEFTRSLPTLRAAIESLGNPDGNTCMYDATAKIASILNRTAGLDRKAIILFTDGIDETDTKERCSVLSLEQAVGEVQGYEVPIYTIGLCKREDEAGSNPCNATEDVQGEPVVPIEFMASQTNGFHEKAENQALLVQSFSRIMEELTSQRLTWGNVRPAQGGNTFVLRVFFEGQAEPITSEEFTFRFLGNLPPPIPAVSIEPHSRLNECTQVESPCFEIPVTIQSNAPETIGSVEMTIRDTQAEEGAAPVAELSQAYSGGTVVFEVPTDKFEPREHRIEVRVRPKDTSSDYFVDEDGLSTLAIGSLTPDSFQFTLSQPRQDNDNKRIVADVAIEEVSELETDFLKYTVTILDPNRDNIEVGRHEDPQLDLENPQVAIAFSALAESMQQPGAEVNYMMQVELLGPDGQYAVQARPFPFTYPSFWGTYIGPYLHWIIISVLIVVGGTIGWFLVPRKAPKPAAPPLPQPMPQNSLTIDVGPQGPAPAAPAATSRRAPEPPQHLSMLIRVTETDIPAQKREEKVTLPCTVGRGEAARFRIMGDKNISRIHAEITTENGAFYVTDRKSTHGTFIEGNPLNAGKRSQALTGLTRVRLGPHTCLEIEPYH